MKNIIIIIMTFMCCSCRNTLSVGYYKTLEEAKQNGALLYEYFPDSAIIYDSIKIKVKDAYLQKAYWYEDYHSNKKREAAFQWFTCRFEESDYWPNYGLDSISSDSSYLFVSWRIEGGDYIIRSRSITENVYNPDTIVLRITEYTHIRDSAGGVESPWGVVSERILDSLVLVKKQEDSVKDNDDAY